MNVFKAVVSFSIFKEVEPGFLIYCLNSEMAFTINI